MMRKQVSVAVQEGRRWGERQVSAVVFREGDFEEERLKAYGHVAALGGELANPLKAGECQS